MAPAGTSCGPGDGRATAIVATSPARMRDECGPRGVSFDRGEQARDDHRLDDRHRRGVATRLLGDDRELDETCVVSAARCGDAHRRGPELLDLVPQAWVPPERLGRAHPLGRTLLFEEGPDHSLQRRLLIAEREVGTPQHEIVGHRHPIRALTSSSHLVVALRSGLQE